MTDNTREGAQAGRACRHKGDRGECLAPDCNCPDAQSVSPNAPIRARCSNHPEREAVAENDMRTRAVCRECYDEWLGMWRGSQ